MRCWTVPVDCCSRDVCPPVVYWWWLLPLSCKLGCCRSVEVLALCPSLAVPRCKQEKLAECRRLEGGFPGWLTPNILPLFDIQSFWSQAPAAERESLSLSLSLSLVSSTSDLFLFSSPFFSFVFFFFFFLFTISLSLSLSLSLSFFVKSVGTTRF